MKNKGQALVEFVMILPILLLILLGIIDFGNIFYQKYTLENDLDYVTELVKQNKTTEINYYVTQNKITSSIEKKSTTTTIKLNKQISIHTPILNHILGKQYMVEAKRVIASE